MNNKANAILKELNIEAMLVTSIENVRYFTGFMGDSSYLLFTKDEQFFITDFRYMEAAKDQLGQEYQFICTNTNNRAQKIGDILFKNSVKNLGIEYKNMTLNRYYDFDKIFDVWEYVDISEELSKARSTKTPEEIERMRQGAKINELAFSRLLGVIKPGITEYDIKAELLYQFYKHGADSAFDPIIASGPNGSYPHAVVSDRKIQPGDLITMDFGCKYQGYCTDITRTIGVGNIDKTAQTIYNIVMTAQGNSLAAVKAGAEAAAVDKIAREYIQSQKYGEYFDHGVGHGVGVEIHEAPRVAPQSQDILEENMVITIEPGIYIPGKLGVRIEDMVLVTQDGAENFYELPKDLIIL